MKKGTVEKALRNFGLSEKEAKLYIFLGKHGPLKAGIISKQLKIHKGQVYRLLKVLQKKELVEATLEYPTRYITVPFEKVVDSYIKAKREEVGLIEESKQDLLSDWKKISHVELDSSLEKFSIIEGKKKIFNKISQMIKETNSQFSVLSTVSDLFRADQFGVFDISINYSMSNIRFRILTQVLKKHLKGMKLIKTKLEPVYDLRAINPILGSPKFSKMAIRDRKEIILFISDANIGSSRDRKEVCLVTNCKSIIQSFLGTFEELWQNSISIDQLIAAIESGKSPLKTQIIKDPVSARKRYYDVLDSAKKELSIVTSSKGLEGFLREKKRMRDLYNKGVTIEIMAPITSENLGVAKQLLDYCEVRHIPLGYLETTIIDNQHLFQFREMTKIRDLVITPAFTNTFYTNDLDYIRKIKTMLHEIWKNTRIPSSVSLESVIRPPGSANYPNSEGSTHDVLKKLSPYEFLEEKSGKITEKDVLSKFHNAKKYLIVENSTKNTQNIIRYFGTVAFASIHPPNYFDLPDFMIGVWEVDNRSSFGEQSFLTIYLWHDKPTGHTYIPVASVQNTAKGLATRKSFYTGSPAAQNILFAKTNQLQVKVQGPTVFLGWTVPIPLSSEYILPPSCILFEGYGEVKPGRFNTTSPSGRKMEIYYNSLEAFVTFFHPKSKYSSPGTEGFIDKEMILTYS